MLVELNIRDDGGSDASMFLLAAWRGEYRRAYRSDYMAAFSG